jgi:hypothetical protein
MVYVLHDVEKKSISYSVPLPYHHKSAVPSMQISVDETGKYQQNPGQDSTGDIPALSHSSLIRNP